MHICDHCGKPIKRYIETQRNGQLRRYGIKCAKTMLKSAQDADERNRRATIAAQKDCHGSA